MHISDGILNPEICLAGYAGAIVLTGLVLKKTKEKDIPKISLMGAAFFVSSLIHIKIGMVSVHLTLLGILGIILGTQAIPAIIVGLFFQALMFGHGGITTLGINSLIFSIPAIFAHYIFIVASKRIKNITIISLTAASASMFAVIIASLLVLLVIYFSGEEFAGIAYLFSISNALLAFVEGFITFFIIRQILTIKPDMLKR